MYRDGNRIWVCSCSEWQIARAWLGAVPGPAGERTDRNAAGGGCSQPESALRIGLLAFWPWDLAAQAQGTSEFGSLYADAHFQDVEQIEGMPPKQPAELPKWHRNNNGPLQRSEPLSDEVASDEASSLEGLSVKAGSQLRKSIDPSRGHTSI
ncbi:hypothetical protein [Geminicoccus harenae]|uniref:hypothetical protein n=1 Tax=Geminicoccus harenae TaxID=2498453 RepID=UPI00168B84C8|nr:hypothetical protein [Geminicoccus harenae]